MNSSKRVLKELCIGIGIHALAFMLVGAIFMRPYWLYFLSLLAGAGAACGVAYHMYDTLDRALELKAKNARGFVTARSLLRLLLCLALMIGGVLIHWTSFVGVTVGLLGLKTGAFLNPYISKRLNKIQHPATKGDDI